MNINISGWEGLTVSLVLAVLLIGFLSFWTLKRVIPPHWLLLSLIIKLGIPFVYFTVPVGNAWFLLDDITYYNQGVELLNAGYNPFTIFFNEAGMATLFRLSGGTHILYGWLNLFSMFILGPYYYSPVFFNIFLTCISGYFIYKISIFCGFERRYSSALVCFFILHWDVLVWSSFLNLKDVVVLTMTVILFYALVLVQIRLNFTALITVAVVLFAFLWIRFYVPIMVLLAFGLYYLFVLNGIFRVKLGQLIVILIIGALIFFELGVNKIGIYFSMLDVSPSTIVTGAIRMILTPQPWSIDPKYSFLLIPSIFHLFFIVPMLVGGCVLWVRSKKARFFIIYFLISILLYASFDELQGPRHRVQLLMVIVWMQFHFIWEFLKLVVEKKIPRLGG